MASGTTPSIIPDLIATARSRGVAVWWDLDLRPSSWATADLYGSAVKPVLTNADVVIGTEEEFAVLLGLHQPTRSELIDVVIGLDLPLIALKLGTGRHPAHR